MQQLDLERAVAERHHGPFGAAADGPRHVQRGTRPACRRQG